MKTTSIVSEFEIPEMDPNGEYWYVDAEMLIPGDIILTATPDSWVSRTISLFDGSPFSHAIICSDREFYCVESADYGVVHFDIRRFLVRDPNNVRILRHLDYASYRGALREAANFAEKQVSRPYATAKAIASPFPWPRTGKAGDGSFFCSHLVAYCYEKVHLPLYPNIPAHKVTPRLIAECPSLINITGEGLLKKADRVRQLSFTGYLDGDTVTSLVEAGVLAERKILNDVRPEFKRIGLESLVAGTYPRLLIQMSMAAISGNEWPQSVDAKLAAAIINSQLLMLPRLYAPPYSPAFLQDQHLRSALARVNPRPPNEVLENLLSHFRMWQTSRLGALRQREQDILFWRKMLRNFNLRSFQLQLALLEDVQHLSERHAHVLDRCATVLEIEIQNPGQTESVLDAVGEVFGF